MDKLLRIVLENWNQSIDWKPFDRMYNITQTRFILIQRADSQLVLVIPGFHPVCFFV